jgi:hypothetical protein
VNASVQQVFQLITDIGNWKSWTNVKASRVLTPTGWKKGALILFIPSIFNNLLGLPLVCKIYEHEENRLIKWGIKLGSSEIIHQFTFSSEGENKCSVHQEEWASGVMYLASKPIEKFIENFDIQMGNDLVSHFAWLSQILKKILSKS